MSTVIKPIKTEKDYEAALEHIDFLFDAEEGTDEADLRDVLVLLVEHYEEQEFPMDVPDPISAIKFRMDQEDLTQRDLIPLIGSRSKVSEVLSGKRDLNIKMIRAIHRHLKIPAEVLLQESAINNLEEIEGINFDLFPVREMIKYGAFDGIDIENSKDSAEDLIRGLIHNIGFDFSYADIKFRKTRSARLNSKLKPYALQGWIFHLLHEASMVKINTKYDEHTISANFISSIVHLSLLDNGPKLAQEFLKKNGIILVVIHHYKNTYLDGAAYITLQNQPIIGLTLRYDRLDNFWFNLLHEIGHIKMHLSSGDYIADDMSLRRDLSSDLIENEADEFAESAFFPNGFDLDVHETISRNEVFECARKNQIHPAIVAGKIQYLKNNYRLFANLVGRGQVREQFNMAAQY